MNDTRNAMQRLCEPRSIAVIGASEDLGKFGGRVMHQLVRHGYDGTVFPINPRRDTINGLRAYASVSAVPEAPDAAIIAVPPTALLRTVQDCVSGGVGVAIVITGNLAVDGRDGSVLEGEVVAAARAGGMRILGPNCLGVINPPARLAFSPSVTMAVDTLPAGPVGIASQSGALMTAMFIRGHDAGVGFSRCISVGNQADLELADAFEYLVDDEATGAICLYVEGLKDRERFCAAAERASADGKPVVAVKAGRTRAGAAMASSHTGAMAGSHEAFTALARRLGIVVTDQAEAAVLCAHALARHGAPRAPGLAVLSSSGGAAVLASDAVAADGALCVAQLAEATQAVIAPLTAAPTSAAMIDFGGFRRPFQLDEILAVLRALARDPAVGAMVYVMTPQPLMMELGEALADLDGPHGVPVAMVSTAGSVADDVHRRLRERGFPVHATMDDALRVLRALMDHRRECRRPSAGPLPVLDDGALAAVWQNLEPGLLTEPEAKSLLRAAGVPVTREQIASTVSGAVRAARELGHPVALKALARGLVHKSDAGAVCLSLDDDDAVAAAFERISEAVARGPSSAELEGVLVQEMGQGGVAEIFVGARQDPQHGPVLLVGAGGVMVEILRDVAVLALPADAGEVLAALQCLTSWPLLCGARGRPHADVGALVACAVRIGALMLQAGGRLAELDVNPLLVRARGEGVLALDARGLWAVPTTDNPTG
jgi:acetyl-CoA synthetase (ADP-forming)